MLKYALYSFLVVSLKSKIYSPKGYGLERAWQKINNWFSVFLVHMYSIKGGGNCGFFLSEWINDT